MAKPTISTMAKLTMASTPVTVSWLVTANGWLPTKRDRHHAEEVGEQDEHEQREDIGTNLRPFGPMFVSIMSVTKPVKPSTATCQRPGHDSRFMPPSMKATRATNVSAIHSARIGEGDTVARDLPVIRAEQRLDQELVHRIDLARFCRHAFALLVDRRTPRAPARNLMMLQKPPTVPSTMITTRSTCPVSEQSIEQPADHAPPTVRRAGWTGRFAELLIGIGRRRRAGPLRFRGLRPLQSLIERIKPCILRSLEPARPRRPSCSFSRNCAPPL